MTLSRNSQKSAEAMVSRIYAAPRNVVWEAWNAKEGIEQWFGPFGLTTRMLAMDVRTGGMLHYLMEHETGDIRGRFSFIEVDEPCRMMSVHCFTDARSRTIAAPHDNRWPMALLTTLTFEDADDGTLVTFRWSPLDATTEQTQAFAESVEAVVGGWSSVFEQFGRFLAQRD